MFQGMYRHRAALKARLDARDRTRPSRQGCSICPRVWLAICKELTTLLCPAAAVFRYILLSTRGIPTSSSSPTYSLLPLSFQQSFSLQ